MNSQKLGLPLPIIGTTISILGVVYNNIFLLHITAMWIWMFSNALFVVYFGGRSKGWWNGGFSDGFLCLNYSIMLVSGAYGLMQYYITIGLQ